jgi:hypothetical protein
LMLLCLIFPILYVKLFEATKFSETGLDIQFSENSFFGL